MSEIGNEPDVLAVKLTERELYVLESLAKLKDRPASKDLTSEAFPPEVRGYWAAPIDFEGTNGSHHSYTATQLAKKGLVDRYKGGRVNFFKSRSKGSCGYRINAAGLAYLARLQGGQP